MIFLRPLLLPYLGLTPVVRAGLFRRQDAELTSTSFPGSTTSTKVEGATTVTGIEGSGTVVSVAGTSTTWTGTPEGETSQEVPLPGTSTTLTVSGTSVDITLTQSTTVELSLAGLTTTWIVGDASTGVTLEGTATTVTVTGSTSVAWVVSETTTAINYGGTTITFTTREDDGEGTLSTILYAGTAFTLTRGAVSTTVSLVGTEVGLSYDGKEETLTLSGSTTSSSSEEENTSTEDSSSGEDTSSTEETTSTEESSSMQETTNPEESTTSGEETSSTPMESTPEESTAESSTESMDTGSDTTSPTGTPSTATSPTPTPTANPTYCEVVRGPLTPEEEVQLAVLFGDSSGGTTFADYVVSYASQLVAQIDSVANIAVGDNDYAFTTAFDTIDIPGVLGLASAAPIYPCFLSTLWAEALRNPQQYAKRAIPSQDEKIKLIVLFEKRATDGLQFDYAELLVDDTNNLIAEVQSVAGAAGAAAVGGDLSAYASLFANVDVAQFLSIATEAPVYTEGLSSAFVTALESYSQSVNRPTSVVMTTHTYTTVSTIVTNVVSGAVTVPTTIFSTVVVTSVGPATSGRETYTSHTTEPRIGVTSETVSEVVRETTLPNGEVTMVTERVTVGAPGAASPTAAVPAPGERVTVEIVTGANGRVETRTVTVREETRASAAAQTTRRPEAAQDTRRPNVAYYTEVRGGTTYVHTVEIQTKNNALRRAAALGIGALGAAALLLL